MDEFLNLRSVDFVALNLVCMYNKCFKKDAVLHSAGVLISLAEKKPRLYY